ncbi:cytochrome c oxidase assembly protein [Rhodococcus fascians]|nr:cytochrome c oxidase assembly protein [Rhodococcus fascians]MBY4430201.1 cytochrome c oxidase assembly protein [Rhodococcus fascians]
MNHDHGGADATVVDPGTWWSIAMLVAAVAVYVFATTKLEARQIYWPMLRTTAWLFGVLSAGLALIGPLAERAHHDFAAHMVAHVLLGMLGPLLLVLAAPVTLVLRVLPVSTARRLARLLASSPAAVLTNPFVAGALNVGGLWVLYRSDLYGMMHTNSVVHVAVHAHILAAGYLFTYAVLGGPDPAPHRMSAPWRVTALILTIAAHNVLAKTLYAHPPANVTAEQARVGSEIMYYGGAPIEVALIILVCRPWLLPRERIRAQSQNAPRNRAEDRDGEWTR